MNAKNKYDPIVERFAAAAGSYVSGELLSRELGISRTAVWKRIRRLEEEGYRFESSPKLGYRLIGMPDKLNASELQSRLTTVRFGRDVKVYERVESTQNVVHEALKDGAEEGATVIAEEQTIGRGRQGRVFHSPSGKGIWMSFLIKPNLPLHCASHMTLLLSVAMCRAVRKVCGLDVQIKWPNDLLIDRKKVCGILVESIAEADTVTAMVAGVGVSVNLEKHDFPPELREKATSLRIAAGGEPLSREELISEFFTQFESLYELYRKEGFAPVRSLWEALTCTLDAPVAVSTPQGVVSGVAVGITEEGALRVRDGNGVVRTLFSGDLAFTDTQKKEKT